MSTHPDAPQQAMSHTEKIEAIARVCHDANKAWCEAHGDDSQLPWEHAKGWQRNSAMKGVEFALQGRTPAEQHQAWCEEKLGDGWVEGPVKDPDAKTHPCLVPYEQLDTWQRTKDALFLGVVHALAPSLGLASTPADRLVMPPEEVDWSTALTLETRNGASRVFLVATASLSALPDAKPETILREGVRGISKLIPTD